MSAADRHPSQANRLATGGRIDRTRRIAFRFEGRSLHGHPGDTLASALLANDVRLVARSFKYHRPRGIWGAGVEEPNAIVDLWHRHRHDPNARATCVELDEDMSARGVHAWPSLRLDLLAGLDLLHRFLPAGFYYKTFMKPDWQFWEGLVRRLAGLGRVRDFREDEPAVVLHAHCDLLVVGAGPAGLAAARIAADAGLRVLLVDEQSEPGGSLLAGQTAIDGQPALDWVGQTLTRMASSPDARLMPRTTAFGCFDQGHVALIESRPGAPAGVAPYRLWKLRTRHVVLASGAIERPLVFPDNDRPGVMSAAAVGEYLNRYAVRAGRRAVVFTNNDSAYRSAVELAAAGAEVSIVDSRDAPDPTLLDTAESSRIPVWRGREVIGCEGGRYLRAVRVADRGGRALPAAERLVGCDLLAVSGGWNPTVHLWSQAGGRLRHDSALGAFLPDTCPQPMTACGGAAGVFGAAAVLASGHAAGRAAIRALGASSRLRAPRVAAEDACAVEPHPGVDRPGSRQWLDLMNDVTTRDVELAAAENYVSVEHLKRYTTLGMATDQGRTSNVNGLSMLGQVTGREIQEVGTTTFRPPYTPVPFGAFAGGRRGALYAPLRRSPLHAEQQRLGARFDEYGGWLRAACFPRDDETEHDTIAREVQGLRQRAGLFDGSSLGKIEVTGPDAAEFLDLIYLNMLARLGIGQVRYCLLLSEHGKVFDDGVVARLAADRYLLSPSSSHAAAVFAMLEEWRQCEYPGLRVTIENVTAAWATVSVSGPRARDIVTGLATDIDLARETLPHMSIAEGHVAGVPARVARVSFTGETGFEISVPAGHGAALWRELERLGGTHGLTPFGVESLLVARAEKGYLLIGRDTDGDTEPDDVGFGETTRRKSVDYVGRRSLLRPDTLRGDRRQLVGLLPVPRQTVLPNGAHVVVAEQRRPALDAGEPPGSGLRSLGYVTSSYTSPTLGHGIALALVERGRLRAANRERVAVFHLGERFEAEVVSPCFLDPSGQRLHG